MSKTFLILVVVVALLLFLKEYIQNRRRRLRSRPSAAHPRFPYTGQPALLSSSERHLWNELTEAAGQQFTVFSKVRVADVVRVNPGLPSAEAAEALTQIETLSLDYLVCRRSNLAITGAVALCDSGEDQNAGHRQAALLEGALAAAGIPLLRLSARTSYGAEKLRDELHRAMGGASPPPHPQHLPGGDQIAASMPSAPNSGTCPSCGAALVKRRITGGRLDGRTVLACPNYPGCKRILPMTAGQSTGG